MVNIVLAASAAASFVASNWDYVIVGGGTAGLALATRLSEDSSIRVAVLEAGLDNSTDPAITTIGDWATTYSIPGYNWGFETVPQSSAAGQQVAHPRGKLLGGSSGINAMEWTLASKDEYDAFATLGNEGWDFDSLLPYFMKAENYASQTNNPNFPGAGGITSNRGTKGPLIISWNIWYSSLTSAFINGLETLGFKVNTNADNGNNLGIQNIPRTGDNTDSKRQFSATTYLPQAQSRNNIQVLVGAQATKIVFENSTGDLVASGVQFTAGGQTYTIPAQKEVILSAGSLMTPQLLELSGIGQSAILSQYGIETLVELPVGENLQDHLMLSIEYNLSQEAQGNLTLQPVPTNLKPTPGVNDAVSSMSGTPFLWAPLKTITSSDGFNELVSTFNSYLSSGTLTPLEKAQFEIQQKWLTSGSSVAEVEIIFAAFPGTPGLPLPDGTYGAWMPSAHVHPASRGTVHITSADPTVLPAVDPKYLSRDFDLKALSEILNFTQTLAKTGEFGSQIATPIAPPPDTTGDDLTTWIKQNIATVFHPIGTAAMAPQNIGGVVSPQLVVYGTKNLRVVDASIIPMQLAAATQATVYAIAEKAADLIKSAA